MKFVRLFQPRFAALVATGDKTQTIRPVPKRMPKPGDIIDCREWTGKPYRSKQKKLGEFKIRSVEVVGFDTNYYGIVNEHATSYKPLLHQFARADGFRDWPEMLEWFEREHGLPFRGILIRWEKGNK